MRRLSKENAALQRTISTYEGLIRLQDQVNWCTSPAVHNTSAAGLLSGVHHAWHGGQAWPRVCVACVFAECWLARQGLGCRYAVGH